MLVGCCGRGSNGGSVRAAQAAATPNSLGIIQLIKKKEDAQGQALSGVLVTFLRPVFLLQPVGAAGNEKAL